MITWNVIHIERGTTACIPREWAAEAGDIHIIVHRHKDYDPRVWLLSAIPFFSLHELDHLNPDAAKAEAVRLVREKVQGVLADLGN